MTDTSVINPDQPYRMPDQQAVQDWRNSTPLPQQGGAPASLAPQSPLSALGPPPTPTAGSPPERNVNFPQIPQKPTLQQLGPAPDAKDYQKGALAFASAMAVLGAVASKFTRVSGATALSAFAGAINGWKQGNLQAYEDAAKKWQEDTKATIQNNKQILEDYKLTLENRQLNIDQQMSELQIKAAKWHDQMTYDAAAAKNYTLVAKIYEKNVEYTQKAQDAAAKLQEKRDEQRQKNEQSAAYWLSPDGQAKLSTLQPSQQAAVKQLIDIYASKAKGPSPQQLALNRYMEEHPHATGEDIQKFNAAGRPARSAAAMSLQKFLEENPNATADDIQAFQAKQAELSAAGRTRGVKETNLDIILNVTDSAIPAALAASEKVPRGSFVPLNQIIQYGKVKTSNTELKQFGLANLQLAEGWARAMNVGGVMRESDRDLALAFLSTADSKETYKALVLQLQTQIQRERAAIQSGKQQTISAPGGSSTPAAATPAASAPTSGAATDPAKMSDDDLRKKLGL